MAGKEISAKKYVVRLSADPQRKRAGATAAQGADPVKGRCLGARTGVE
jgi:hypothetical protein